MESKTKGLLNRIISTLLILSLLLCLYLPSLTALAQTEAYEVCFYVSEIPLVEGSCGTLLENAYVYIYDSQGELVDMIVTWMAGEAWSVLDVGDYTAYATTVGYKPMYYPFTVTRDECLVHIEMEKEGIPIYGDNSNIKTGEKAEFYIKQDPMILETDIVWSTYRSLYDILTSDITPLDEEGISTYVWDTTDYAPWTYTVYATHCLLIGTKELTLRQDTFDPAYCTITGGTYSGSVTLDVEEEFTLNGTEYNSVEMYKNGEWVKGPFTFDEPGEYELALRYKGDSGAYTSSGSISFELLPQEQDDSIYALQTHIDAYTDEVFTVQISTPASVTGIGVKNENGIYMGKQSFDCVVDPANSQRLIWTVGLMLSTVSQSRTMYIYTKTDGDYEYSDVSVDVAVTKRFIQTEPAAFAEVARPVSLNTLTAEKNEPIVMTVRTNTYTQNIKLTNETGDILGKISQSYVDKNGDRVWTIVFRIGSKGANRIITVSLSDANGEYSEQSIQTPGIKIG